MLLKFRKTILLVALVTVSSSIFAQQMDVLLSTYYKDARGAACKEEDSASEKILIYATVDGRKIDVYSRGLDKHFNLQNSSLYSDTTDSPKSAEITRFYPNGQREEVRKYAAGKLLTATHYTNEGKMDATASYREGKVVEQNGWDAQGNSIKNFIYEQGAEFPGGNKKWKKFIRKNLNADIAVVNGAPMGSYTVIISFVIERDGTVRDVFADNDPGFGTAQEAVRVIKKSPNWIPSIWLNRSGVASYRQRQQLTFQVFGKNTDTTVLFLDSANRQVDPSKADYKTVTYRINDSTHQTIYYSYPNGKKVLESTLISGTLSKKYTQIIVKYDEMETKVSEVTTIDRQIQRIIRFYPDGSKYSETIYGSTGLPIKENRWDEKGSPIKNQ